MNNGFDRLVAILALIASIIAAFYAYRTYKHDFQPELALSFFIIKGEEEISTNSIKIESNNVKHVDGFIEADLPLRIRNLSEADASKITVWIGPKAGDTHNLELTQENCGGWGIAKYHQKDWYSSDLDHLSPQSLIDDDCFKIRVKEDIQEIKLSWEILASRTLGKNGILIVSF